MLRLTQGFSALTIHSSPWSVESRSISKKNLLEKLGLPEKPKKPITPFLMFLENAKHDILRKNPRATLPDVSKMGGKLWNEIDPTEKARLSEKYQIEYRKYKVELEKYEKSLTAEQKAELREAEADLKAYNEQKLMKKFLNQRQKELNKPKAPMNAFMKFALSIDKEGSNNREHLKRMGEKWSKLSDSAKQKYLIEFEREQGQYKKDLSLWEEEMIKQGHVDVVRSKTLKLKLKTIT